MKRTIIYLSVLAIALSSCSHNSKETQTKVETHKPLTEIIAMENQNFTTTLIVDQTPKEVFNAVTNVRGWWSEQIEGGTEILNDVFTYHYRDIHLTKMKLIEVIPEKRVVWLVLDNYFNFVKDTSEWKGNKIIFEITKKGNQTQLDFTQEGLTPIHECYGVCEEAWTNYIQNSLHNLITTGKGQPNPKEGEGYNAQLAEKWNLMNN